MVKVEWQDAPEWRPQNKWLPAVMNWMQREPFRITTNVFVPATVAICWLLHNLVLLWGRWDQSAETCQEILWWPNCRLLSGPFQKRPATKCTTQYIYRLCQRCREFKWYASLLLPSAVNFTVCRRRQQNVQLKNAQRIFLKKSDWDQVLMKTYHAYTELVVRSK